MLLLFWLWARIALASVPTTPIEWARPIALNDSVLLGASWDSACDARGCADSYRVRWTVEAFDAAVPTITRDVTVSEPRTTQRVAWPPFNKPHTVCVEVISVRRTRTSASTTSCRLLESPDADPPPVNLIRWDTLGVTITPPDDSVQIAAGRILHGLFQYRIGGEPSAWADSLPLALTDGRALTAQPTWTVQFCAVAPHRDGVTQVVLVPATMPSASHIAYYVARCGQSARALYANTPVRFWRAPITFAEPAP